MLGGFAGGAEAEFRAGVVVVVESVDVAGGAVDFHVLAVEGPVPRALNDGLRVRVSEDDGAVVVNVRIDARLEVEGDGGDGEGKFAVHDPGGEIDPEPAKTKGRPPPVEF